MTVKITLRTPEDPPTKVADAELHFSEGPLAGLKLIGFAVWKAPVSGTRSVTFPARTYIVNQERRSYALLRPIEDADASENIRGLILEACRAVETPS